MDPQAFVDALRKHVGSSAVDGVLAVLERPPGKGPAPELLELSAWYEGLAAEDRERLRGVLTLNARQVLFGVLAVLDGVRALEGAGAKGHFELRHIAPSGEATTISGDETGPMLHDLL